MAKVKNKNPKRVAAGKARAANALRVGGKFVNKNLVEVVQRDAETLGIFEPDKVLDFFKQNEIVYSETYKADLIQTNRNFEKLKNDIKNYNGQIFDNGKPIKKATAIKKINALNQYLKSEHNVVDFYQKISLSMSGKMKLKIPTPAEIENEMRDGGEVEDYLLSKEIGVIISDKKK